MKLKKWLGCGLALLMSVSMCSMFAACGETKSDGLVCRSVLRATVGVGHGDRKEHCNLLPLAYTESYGRYPFLVCPRQHHDKFVDAAYNR